MTHKTLPLWPPGKCSFFKETGPMLVIDYIIKVGILNNFFRYMIKLTFLSPCLPLDHIKGKDGKVDWAKKPKKI